MGFCCPCQLFSSKILESRTTFFMHVIVDSPNIKFTFRFNLSPLFFEYLQSISLLSCQFFSKLSCLMMIGLHAERHLVWTTSFASYSIYFVLFVFRPCESDPRHSIITKPSIETLPKTDHFRPHFKPLKTKIQIYQIPNYCRA